MKFCTKCGKELLDEVVFCPACGCATEKSHASMASGSPTNDAIVIREFSEKATVIRNLGIVAAILMFGIGIIFSVIIWVKIPMLKRFSEVKTTNPLELAEYKAAQRKAALGTTLSTLPVLGIALSIFIGAIVGVLSII